MAGAFEDHVLEEMRRAIGARSLKPAARINPDANGGCVRRRQWGRLGDHTDAIGKGGDPNLGEAEEWGVVE